MLSVRFDARRHKDIASPSDDIPWRDRRTGTILASGAKQNWPTAEEERYLKRLNKADREQQKQDLKILACEAHAARVAKFMAKM